VLAQGVHLLDRRTRGEQQSVKVDGIFQGNLRVEGQVEHGRSATRDEKEDQGVFLGLAQKG